MNPAPVSLLQLNGLIKTVVRENLVSHWLIAEISEMTVNYSGHCYLEFIQKDEKSERLLARARGTIWANTFRMIRPYFETTTGRPFSEGIKVMVKVSVEFHEVYGLSLNILDIEPTYTVGEIAVRKQKILEKLKSEGVISMNKELELSSLPQRLAIISSKTAAGYEDFVDQLTDNPHGFKYYLKLFPAIMQGNDAEGSIIAQLDKIFQYADLFDAVVIIRGGGAQADLECFNSYWLAYNITQFPLPVLTGIGHEQDDSVVDVVAHTRLKTPTAVAEFLVDSMAYTETELLQTEEQIISLSGEIIDWNKNALKENAYQLNKLLASIVMQEDKKISGVTSKYISAVKNKFTEQKVRLERANIYLEQNTKTFIRRKSDELNKREISFRSDLKLNITEMKHALISFEQALEHNNPINVLNRGYSITTHNGKPVKDAKLLKPGAEIETLYKKGKSKSIIK